MSSRIPARTLDQDDGFTLIELIVVVLVIGVLASIAIPTMQRQRRSSWGTATKTDLSNFALAIESAAVDQSGNFANVFLADTVGQALTSGGVLHGGVLRSGFEFTGTRSVDLSLGAPATRSSFCVVGHNSSSGPDSGWLTYTKTKGGLQITEWTSRDLAEAAC